MFTLPAKKSLGQHFLIDPSYHERIVKAAAIEPGDCTIEIGPGTGLLTKHLLGTPLEKLIAFELDARAIPELQEMFQDQQSRFEVRQEDFLKTNLETISTECGKKLRVVGNIPYYITSPILFKLIDERRAVLDAVMLVQQEVAERLVAKPGTKAYGIPTVLANFFGEVKLLFRVPRGAFRPVPKVDSAVVRIDFSRDFFTRSQSPIPPGFDEVQFRNYVRSLFAMRRKMVRNNLKPFISASEIQGLDQTERSKYLTMRPEQLDISQLLHLFSALPKHRYDNGFRSHASPEPE
ncbi:MAG TPA: 16S rRNA (adenine(1518)-N(6)/adenine(1519)-N(6))-dimethyltransferase RsmA [Candidatus Kapabacteria bacterium]|jgi:16S rRNA (adenine1518-N6/adenine1519-N6)-dimethyltransferase